MPKTEKIRSMFDSIAADYDRLNHLMSLGLDKIWRKKAIRHVCGPAVLDIACGTGDFAIAIAKALPKASVTGIDLSEGMLEVMERKVAAASLDARIKGQQGDCTAMPFEEGSFDSATIAFGIRNFEDRPAALREILRVLRPSGRLVIMELSVPRNRVLRGLYKLYFCHVMPWMGGLVSGDRAAYRYLPASVLAFPAPGEWMQVMRDAGFSNVGHKSLTFGLCRMYTAEK